jgi:hypothetical protein
MSLGAGDETRVSMLTALGSPLKQPGNNLDLSESAHPSGGSGWLLRSGTDRPHHFGR